MSKEWLSAQSFERSNVLISAINAILINAKLENCGVFDKSRKKEIAQAKDTLLSFIKEFEILVNEAGNDKDTIATGSDPRLGSLVHTFMGLKTQQPQTSTLAKFSYTELKGLFQSDKRTELIQYLRDLRIIMEQHAHDDVIKVLGEL